MSICIAVSGKFALVNFSKLRAFITRGYVDNKIEPKYTVKPIAVRTEVGVQMYLVEVPVF